MSYWSLADAAVIQAQIYREWGVAIVKGSGRVPTGLLECTVPNASPRPVQGRLREVVARCSGGFAEAVLLRRRYTVMKNAARARRR